MAADSFNFVTTLVGNELKVPALGVIGAGVVFGLAAVAKKQLAAAENPLIPDKGFSVRNLFEGICLLIMFLADQTIGRKNRKYFPFLGSLFLFILVLNMLELIPGFGPATASAAFNVGLALVVFVVYNAIGIKETGLKHYLRHLCGPDLGLSGWLFPLTFAFGAFMLAIELLSHLLRPVTLTLRLYGNMLAEELVVSIFTNLAPIGFPVPFYFLGTLICFLQAGVFVLLTMVYIQLMLPMDDHSH